MRKFSIFNFQFSVALLLFFCTFFYTEVFAQITNNLGGAPGAVFDIQYFFNLLSKLSCWFLRLGIIALGVMMIVYGLLFLKSRGSSTELSSAKKALGWGVVGGLVIMGVFTIILTIPALLGAVSGNQVSYPIVKIFGSCS